MVLFRTSNLWSKCIVKQCKRDNLDSRVAVAFEFYDETGEGVVTPLELQRQLAKLGMSVTHAEATAMITAVSSDVDARGRPQCNLEQLQSFLKKD